MFLDIGSWFWNPNIWLPPNVTWADLKSNEQIQYTDYRDLIYPLPVAFALLLLRCFSEKYCYKPVGQLLGVPSKRSQHGLVQPKIQRIYSLNENPLQTEIEKGVALMPKSEREVAQWFIKRQKLDKQSKLNKFCESSFRFTFYLFSFFFGSMVLWNKAWLWDIQACWYSYPHQSVDRGVWYYYIIYLSFNWSSIISQFSNVKHKDFWQIFFHFVTILLMSISWLSNMTRAGSLTIFVHDFADILLEATKMAMYTKYQQVTGALLVIFSLSWIITRLGLFPFWLMRNFIFDAIKIVPIFPLYYVINCLLMSLLVLHLFWTYFLLKFVYKSIIVRKVFF